MRPPLLPNAPRPLKPGPATPGDPGYVPGYGDPPPPTTAPGSESGNSNYSPIFVTDDGSNAAPVDDDDGATGIGFQS